MKYSMNPDDIKMEIEHRRRKCLGSSIVFTYRVKATHIHTGVSYTNNEKYTSIHQAAKEAIKGLHEEHFYHHVYYNKHNKEFRESI